MRIIDKELLKSFSGPGRCGWCGKPNSVRHPHHIFSRGAGRVDIPENLIPLCAGCHFDGHNGKITRADFLAVVAAREGTTQDAIKELVWRLRREPKP